MNIAEKYKIWFMISIIIILIGFSFTFLIGLNWGIDFTGGNILHYDIGTHFETSSIRSILIDLDIEDTEIKKAGDKNEEAIVRTPLLTEEEKNIITNEMEARWQNVKNIRMEEVAPIIGNELRTVALISLFIASIGIIAYISYRFQFKFAICAIVAVLHDALIVLSFFAVFRIPINQPFVAAVLLIIGYSINDTIVLFDRIRENTKHYKKKDIFILVNTSIRQTITRSINTSLTTLIVISMLYFFGGETIKDFALALMIGIISGTYSSMFIASPLWGLWNKKGKYA